MWREKFELGSRTECIVFCNGLPSVRIGRQIHRLSKIADNELVPLVVRLGFEMGGHQ